LGASGSFIVENGLIPRAVRAIEQTVPDILITADVALDPYRRDGHDGIVQDGKSLAEAILRHSLHLSENVTFCDVVRGLS
jgi:delta-aminolevulinic acid dehydratase/porphobilinogen synthase